MLPAMFVNTGVPRPLPVGFTEPCLPSPAKRPPVGPQWVHEVKHDGYRLMARRRGDRVRLYTRRGYDWTGRYPRIAQALRSLKVTSAVIDGEAVWCGPDGVSSFDKLHSRAHDDQVFLYAFDLLELDGVDCRAQPLAIRKAWLRKLFARTQGMQFSERLEGDGQQIFEHVCKLGLEGIVSKRIDFPYLSGRSKSWLKTRNPESLAMMRYEDGPW
jgi:bifunctional non-homologous end joining protein LigD